MLVCCTLKQLHKKKQNNLARVIVLVLNGLRPAIKSTMHELEMSE